MYITYRNDSDILTVTGGNRQHPQKMVKTRVFPEISLRINRHTKKINRHTDIHADEVIKTSAQLSHRKGVMPNALWYTDTVSVYQSAFGITPDTPLAYRSIQPHAKIVVVCFL